MSVISVIIGKMARGLEGSMGSEVDVRGFLACGPSMTMRRNWISRAARRLFSTAAGKRAFGSRVHSAMTTRHGYGQSLTSHDAKVNDGA